MWAAGQAARLPTITEGFSITEGIFNYGQGFDYPEGTIAPQWLHYDPALLEVDPPRWLYQRPRALIDNPAFYVSIDTPRGRFRSYYLWRLAIERWNDRVATMIFDYWYFDTRVSINARNGEET